MGRGEGFLDVKRLLLLRRESCHRLVSCLTLVSCLDSHTLASCLGKLFCGWLWDLKKQGFGGYLWDLKKQGFGAGFWVIGSEEA